MSLMIDQESNQSSEQPNLKDLITFTEAAHLSGFTDRHLRKLASEKVIWAVKLGRNWFTTTEAIENYLAQNRKPGPKPKNLNK